MLTDNGWLDNPLDRLPYAVEAPFNSYQRQHDPTCLENTRVDVLREIHRWADGEDERCIFWLNGLAGTGKSTIARTIARTYFERKALGASFFFMRGGGDIGHAGKFVTSIALQLARSIPGLQQYICDAVAERSNIASQSLRDQWQQLVLGPLSKLDGSGCQRSYVLVVDALDECDDDNNIRIVLQLLAEARSLERVQLRVFLTSRPEIPIRYGLYQIPDAEHQDFVLHNMSPSIVDRDISIFLENNLRLIGQERMLGDDWPEAEIIKSLVRKAGGLFIWAATACRFIREGLVAEERLRIILGGVTSTSATNDHTDGIHIISIQEVIRSLIWNATGLFIWTAIACGFVREGLFIEECLHALLEGGTVTPEHHLNSIYMTVLHSSIRPAYTKQETKRFYSMLRDVLGTIVILFSHLSVESLSKLLLISQQEVDQTLKDLHAILDIPKDKTHLLRLHHPSFRDFLLDKGRCRDPNFHIDGRQAHQKLATDCIQLMSKFLKQDICCMGRPGALVADVESSLVEKYLPSEVQYACLYWIQHLQNSGAQLYDNDQIHQFLQEHLLHWLEALGWMRKVSKGIHAIASLESIAAVSQLSSTARTFS